MLRTTLSIMVVSWISAEACAAPTVLNFDDLTSGTILSGGTYAGLTWEDGSPGLLGFPGKWVVPSVYSYPSSHPNNVTNGNGSTLMGITFPSFVDMQGAYVSLQGNNGPAWAQSLRVHGYVGGQATSDTILFTTISTNPTWFDMTTLAHVNRIVFEASSSSQTQAAYGLDDLTFTYIPEPAEMSLGLLALGGGLLRRRGRGAKSKNSSGD
jgi:hypothetical protein